jgi:hypothetical protein
MDWDADTEVRYEAHLLRHQGPEVTTEDLQLRCNEVNAWIRRHASVLTAEEIQDALGEIKTLEAIIDVIENEERDG